MWLPAKIRCGVPARSWWRNLSISRETSLRPYELRRWSMAAVVALVLVAPADALDPARAVSQYLHESWRSEKGLPSGTITSMAQTADGYLWIGTDKGLVRFDGLNFQTFPQAQPD